MKYLIVITAELEKTLQAHFFQNELEQGAFLFANYNETADELRLEVKDAYLVPPEGWLVQHEVYLEMTDVERAKVMRMARIGGYAIIDCHSHPDSKGDVWFSPSDRTGTSEFAAYVRWKLDGKPYTAMVWGEDSVDAVVWHGDFSEPHQIDALKIAGSSVIWTPRGTWHRQPLSYWSKSIDEQ